jgi:hypothetical protein
LVLSFSWKGIFRAFFPFVAMLWMLLTSMVEASSEMELSPEERLIRDLATVEYWNGRLGERMPIYYNNLLSGGYWNMPSARMGQEGEIGFGYSDVPPYRNWNVRCQLIDRLEISGNYRIFRGVADPVLSQYGFGDFSDKGVNIKLACWHAEDSNYALPGFAVGLEDFLGTKSFKSHYAVLTQVFLKQNLELSIGYGRHRIRRCFGGFQWMPFRTSSHAWLSPLAIVGEYDAIPYRRRHIEPHPKGRTSKTPWNVGIKYRLWDQFDLSLSYVRGSKWSFGLSTFYNFGYSKGLLPKTETPLPYTAPANMEPLGQWRTPIILGQDLVYAFRSRGFMLLEATLTTDDKDQKVLRLRVWNEIYRQEEQVREQLNGLVANLTPMDVETVIVTIDCEGMPIQEYCFPMVAVRAYRQRDMGAYELKILSPLREVESPSSTACQLMLFKQRRKAFCCDLLPKTLAYFGSAQGKFKYALGAQAVACGYLWDDLYYTIACGCIAFGDISKVQDKDRLNPSQLINVRTDVVRYYQQKGITLDQAYIQKVWNLGSATYGRLAAGYFEEEYGGCLAEFLYYPLNSPWAVGVECAGLKKRKPNSWFSFTNQVRKLKGFTPTYQDFLGAQYFVNLYYNWQEAGLDFRIKAGKFLANDFGARYEVSRYFPSGFRVGFWYTTTNGRDKINGQTYYDKGIYISMPLDLFYNHCERAVWRYGMSAWLRDVGASAYTGTELYNLINENRQYR